MAAGTWESISTGWAATQAMTATSGAVFAVCNGLHRIDPQSGKYDRLGTAAWKDTRYMTALSDKLYMLDAGTIYETSLDGTWKALGKDWGATEAFVAMDGALYAVCNGLYRIDPASGKYERLGTGSWKGTAGMTAAGGHLYIVHDGTIYATAKDGSWKAIGKDWAATESITAAGDALYAVCNGLYGVNAQTGKYERLGTGAWKGTRHMAALGEHLYMVNEGALYRTALR